MARVNQIMRRQNELDPFWGPWSDLFRDFDQVFDASRGGITRPDGAPATRLAPAVDISETDQAYLLSFDLPGMKRNDIDIELKGNSLIVSGTRNFSEDVKKDNYRRVERQYGEFRREFTLPDNVSEETIEASYENGVLHLTIPKLEKAKPKKIQIGERASLKKLFSAEKKD